MPYVSYRIPADAAYPPPDGQPMIDELLLTIKALGLEHRTSRWFEGGCHCVDVSVLDKDKFWQLKLLGPVPHRVLG